MKKLFTAILAIALTLSLTSIAVKAYETYEGLFVQGESIFEGNQRPLFNDTYDLGHTSYRWRNIYGNALTSGTSTVESSLDFVEISGVSNPAANTLRLYVEDIQGFSFFKYLDSSGMKREVLRDSMILVKNDTGSTIAANRIVYASGSVSNVPQIALAKADSTSTMPAIGVTIESIADGAFGRVMQVGLLENINTNSLAEGNLLYVSAATAGVPTITAPITPYLTQEIGTVLVKSATVGAIQIVARGVTGDEYGTSQNNFSIGNNAAGSKTLTFNASTDASITWDEAKFDFGANSILTTGSVTTTNLSITGASAGCSGKLYTDAAGNVLCGTDATGGGGGGSGLWTTTTDSMIMYPVDITDKVVVGAVTSTNWSNIFEVVGLSTFDDITALDATTSNLYISNYLNVAATSTLSKGIQMADDQRIYLDTGQTRWIQYSSDSGEILFGDSAGAGASTYLTTYSEMVLASHTGTDGAGSYEPYIYMTDDGLFRLVNTTEGTTKYVSVETTDGLRIMHSAASANMAVLNASGVTGRDAFLFPDLAATGTLAVLTSAMTGTLDGWEGSVLFNVTSTQMSADDFGAFTCTGADAGCSLDTTYLTEAKWYATTTHALISSLPSLSITESQISDLDHYTDADVSTYLTGGTGITEAAGAISFDCSEVEGTGINCAGEAITLDTTTNMDTATLATTITVTDNESTAENNAVLFTSGGALEGGNLGIESDGTFFYTPSTGKVNATAFLATTYAIGDADIVEAELEILDGATVSTTQLNYLNQCTGTTGTTNTNLVFSTSPTIVTPTFTTSITTPAVLTGDTTLTIGDATTDTITFVADGTGNAEFTFPADVIGDADIDWGSGAGQIDTDDITEGSTNKFEGTTAGDYLTLTGEDIDLDPEIASYTAGIFIENASSSDDFANIDYAFEAITLTKIYCISSSETILLDLQIDDGTPADVNGTDISCGTAGTLDESLGGDTAFSATDKLDLIITSGATGAGDLTIKWYGTKDD